MTKQLSHLAGLFLIFGVPLLAEAQIKFADFKPVPDQKPFKLIVFQPAKNGVDLKHGTLVSLTLNDETKITGHVVYLDANDKRLFVRTNPGAVPVGYSEKDIKAISKGVRANDTIVPAGLAPESWNDLPNGLQENARGVIRIKPVKQIAAVKRAEGVKPALPAGNASKNVVEPEIFKQVIYNGALPTLTYYSTVISPGEHETLAQIQKAENVLNSLAYRKDLHESAINLSILAQEEQLRTVRLVNLTLENENVNVFPLVRPSPAPGLLPGPFLPNVPPVGPAGTAPVPPEMNAQVWNKAVEELQRLRGMAKYEDGNLVAVVPKK